MNKSEIGYDRNKSEKKSNKNKGEVQEFNLVGVEMINLVNGNHNNRQVIHKLFN
jgi:hypothetical protein